MLFYGESYMKNIVNENTLLVSLTSYDESIRRLDHLLPPRELGRYVMEGFDNAYYNYLFGDNEVFYEFFSIIYNLYCGVDIFIAASSNEWSEVLIESLLKLIQQRYGYNAYCIRSMEDYIHAKSYFNDTINPQQLANLDMDRARYTYLMEEYRLRTKQPEVIYNEVGRTILEE